MGFLIYVVAIVIVITTTVAVIQNTPTSANVNGSADRNPDQNGWYNSPITIRWAGADNLGNQLTNCVPTPYSGNDGKEIRVTGYCIDKSDTRRYGEYLLDYDSTLPTKPTISANINNNKFFGGETVVSLIRFTFSSEDSTSGINYYDVTINGNSFSTSRTLSYEAPQEGNYELKVNAVDKAGNESIIGNFIWTYAPIIIQ